MTVEFPEPFNDLNDEQKQDIRAIMNRWFDDHPNEQIEKEIVNKLYQYIMNWMPKYDPETFNEGFRIWHWTHVEIQMPGNFLAMSYKEQNRASGLIYRYKQDHPEFDEYNIEDMQELVDVITFTYKDAGYNQTRFDAAIQTHREEIRILQEQEEEMRRKRIAADERERQRREIEERNAQIDEEGKRLFLPAKWQYEAKREWKNNQFNMIKQYYIDTKLDPSKTISEDLYRYITEYMTGDYEPSRFINEFSEFLKQETRSQKEESQATKTTKRRRRSSKVGEKNIKNLEMPNVKYTENMPKEKAIKFVQHFYTIYDNIKPNIGTTTEFVEYLTNEKSNPKTPFEACNGYMNYRTNNVVRVGNLKAFQYYGANSRKRVEKEQLLNKLKGFFSTHKEIPTTDENITQIAEYIKVHPKVTVAKIPVIN